MLSLTRHVFLLHCRYDVDKNKKGKGGNGVNSSTGGGGTGVLGATGDAGANGAAASGGEFALDFLCPFIVVYRLFYCLSICI